MTTTQAVIAIIERSGLTDQPIAPSSTLGNDLWLDSLERTTLIAEIESWNMYVTFPDEFYSGKTTVQQLADYIDSQTGWD